LVTKTNPYDLILVANSPGELSALVKPAAEILSKNLKGARIILALTPCQYTSGKELEYIKTINGISEIITADDYKKWILKNSKPAINFNEKGIVLYLGGDLAHAILIAGKVKYPALAYVQDRIGWKKFYKKFLVPDAETRNKLGKNNDLKNKIKVVGNLMVDSVAHLKKWSPQKNVVTFMPGSRGWQIKHMTPLYEKIMEYIKIERPDIDFQLVSSPFVKAQPIKGAKIINFEEVINSELVITIPGTNTARLAMLGVPMISIFPLDDPDVIPLEGLPHFIGKIPYLGSKFKQLLADMINRRTKFFALPNMKAGKEIVPEIRGTIDPLSVAIKAFDLLKDAKKRKNISKELIAVMGKPGAALKIMEEIDETLRKAA
jgi:lipid-A-disaccharide synthase